MRHKYSYQSAVRYDVKIGRRESYRTISRSAVASLPSSTRSLIATAGAVVSIVDDHNIANQDGKVLIVFRYPTQLYLCR